jgi:cytochrome bd-type quinol oxidase subunit 1
MITVLLIVHALLAVFTLGALTHQALSVWWPATAGHRSLFASFRAVRAASYANTIVALYLLTATAGAIHGASIVKLEPIDEPPSADGR